jgi:dTDP-4-dehydrorhamnose reductase
MKILVTGGNGQLGREFRLLTPAYKDLEMVFTDVDDLDLTDFGKVDNCIRSGKFEGIIHCAAYTAVDKAETEPDKALLVNATVTGEIAKTASGTGAGMIHFSTDYVFDGSLQSPYKEEDPPNPDSAYGASKLAGENEIMKHGIPGAIIRTSWLYSPFGTNFVKTILNKAKSGHELRVVSDQFGCPTYAHDLAKTVLDLLPRLLEKQPMAIYHYSNEGSTNWYEFARVIIEYAGLSCPVVPVATGDYPALAKRPAYAVMSKEKIKNEFHITVPEWKESLHHCLGRMEV